MGPHRGLFKARTLRFLGSGEACSDYLDFIVDDSGSSRWVELIWSELFGTLAREWDALIYSDVPSDSPTLRDLLARAERDDRCLRHRVLGLSVCPYLPLEATQDAFESALSGSRRYTLTYSRKKLGELSYSLSASPSDVHRDLDRLSELNTRIWQARGQRGSFATSRFVSFHRDVACRLLSRGRLMLCNLDVGGRYTGGLYGFSYKRKLYFYIMSVEATSQNRVNTGDVLLAHCMTKAIEMNCLEFDFLRGDEPYKGRWTNLHRANVALELLNRSRRGRLMAILAEGTDLLRVAFRSLRRGSGAPDSGRNDAGASSLAGLGPSPRLGRKGVLV